MPFTNADDFRLAIWLQADLLRLRQLSTPHLPPPGRGTLWLGLFSLRFAPVLLCRLAHACHRMRLRPIAKGLAFVNYLFFGIEIATRCPIGPGLVLPHTQGTVIGAWRIGRNATIFQGVTLGASEMNFVYDASTRPTLADDVTVGAGAKILGALTLGNGAGIGANAVVLESVPERFLALGVPARLRPRADG